MSGGSSNGPDGARATDSGASAACVACGGRRLSPFVRTPHFTLHLCATCDGLTALPRLPASLLTTHHDSDEYFMHPYFERRRTQVTRAEARCREVLARVRSVAPAFTPQGARHLDVGCDTGIFMETFTRLNGTVGVGIDIAARAVARARGRGLDVHHTDLEHAASLGDFDLITMIDVIEHVPDPVALLRQAGARLRPGGVCYLETPNIRSSVYQIGRAISRTTGGRPAWLCERLFLPEHVQYFSERGLQFAGAAAGMRVRWVGRRPLGVADVNSVVPVRIAVQTLQLADRLLSREILHCAVLTN